MQHDRCRSCGTTERPHRAKGLCPRCYNQAYADRVRQPDARRGRRRDGLCSRITASELRKHYVEQGLSLQDIADRFKCTRALILYLMKRHGIPRRTKSEARRLAQSKGKVRYEKQLVDGSVRTIQIRNTHINKNFFRDWSCEMAYVLGVFFTDGCLSVSRTGYHGASISQKEPELLQKCLVLMRCDATLRHNPNNGAASSIYTFRIHHQDVCRDLVQYGIHPRKSRTIRFPDVPGQHLRHFLRGCWDGDGSICKCGSVASSWKASFVSASSAFIWGIHDALVSLGLPPATVHCHRRFNALDVRWTGARCGKLFHILYDGVPEAQYLRRKYERFRAAAGATRTL